MPETLPTIILTGASGFVGRNFLRAIQNDYRVYAIARRAHQDAYETIADATAAGQSELMLSDNGRDLEDIVAELNAFYRPSADEERWRASSEELSSGSQR